MFPTWGPKTARLYPHLERRYGPLKSCRDTFSFSLQGFQQGPWSISP